MSDSNHHDEPHSQGLLSFFVVIVFAISLVGFLTGTEIKTAPPVRPVSSPAPAPERGTVPEAMSYRELRRTPRGDGSAWETSLQVASQSKPAKLTQETLDAALRRRQQRRAYDGAPPTIPHLVRQNSVAECLACHGEGLRLGYQQAGLIPHDNLTSCTQCHVAESEQLSADDPPDGEGSLPADPRKVPNAFAGTFPKAQGDRAWPIAPPQIPHGTFMRENCMACHGDQGSSPMRSTHTERQSCTQCHAPSAAQDLRPDQTTPPGLGGSR